MEVKIYTFKASAKINIGLRIKSKRADGFHNLETIFYPVNLSDNVTLRIAKDKSISTFTIDTVPKGLISNKDNICYKAITTFLKEFGIKGFYKINIRLKKNIPIGAGLGGGSSDAAAILKGLYTHFKIHDGKNKLGNTALQLGSDVPFFLANKPAYAESRGEKLTPLKDFEIKNQILIVNPGIHISTKWAFGELDKSRKSKIRNKKLVARSYPTEQDFSFASGGHLSKNNLSQHIYSENDFEKVVFKKYPEIKAIKDKLMEQETLFALMSGSGSSVYGIFKKIPAGVKRYFRDKGYKVFVG